MTKQILDQGTTAQWTGAGHGSAEANAKDMAKILAGIGITDINQFGKITVEEDVPYFDEYGSGSTKQKRETYGNIVTGKAVPVTYSERQTGNAWGGTFAGEGNTGYRVDFSTGKPIFYTTGASSNDIVNLFADNPLLAKVATAAAAYFGGPAGVAALQAVQGKSIEDIAKSALLAYAGGQIAGDIAGSESLVNSIGADATSILAKSVGKYVSSEGKASIVDSLVGGTIDIGVNQITDLIPEFSGLSQGQQDFTKNVVRSTIQNGGNLNVGDLVDAAITAGTAAAKASATGAIKTAIAADETVNGAVNNEIDKALTFDATGSADVNAAAALANEQGYNKFTFDGKTYTVDTDQTGRITNLENTVKAEQEATKLATTAANLKGGEFEGVDAAVAATAAKNNTVIGNSEADNLEEAAYLARQRNPTGTTFTYDGQTYTLGASNTAVTQALNETQKTAVLDDIKNAKTFNEAFATARSGLGAGQTFTWQGKEYSTATAQERPELSTPSINELNARNLASSTPEQKALIAAQNDTAARATAAEELARQQAAMKATEKTGFWSNVANSVQNQMKLSSDAANDYLRNNPDSPITNSVSTAMEAAGNLQKNVAGGAALLLDNKPLADAFVKSGDDLTKFGQSIGSGVVDSKNWNDTMDLLDKASGFEKLGVIAGRIMDGTSGLGRQVEVELRQELPGLFLGAGSVKGILVATGLMDTAETAGNAALNTYDNAIKQGKTHADALSDARTAGAVAGMTEAAIQLTLGKVADVVVGKVGNIGAKAGAKVFGEGVVEGGQEGASSLAVNAALGQELDFNRALTQSIAGAAVGKGTAATTSPADIATSETINNNIKTAATSGDPASMNTAITSSVQTALSNGSSVEVAVGSSVNSAITNGADAQTSIDAAVSSAITNDADVAQTVTTSIDSAITAGADVSIAINSTVTSAIKSGADITQTVLSSIKAATAAGVNVSTAITNTANSAITTALSNNVNPTSAITSSVTAAVNAAVSANTNVNANVNTAVNAAVDAAVNAGVDTNTAINSAINAVINSNINPNIKINIDAIKNTAIQTAKTAKEKVELLDTVNNLISGEPVKSTKKTKKKQSGEEALAGGFTFSGSSKVDPIKESFLKTYMTKDSFKDPLEKLREMQGTTELADNQMMQQQIDPYLARILSERNTPEAQPESTPLWNFGQEPDNIDDMIISKAPVEATPEKTFKSGGFVAPLQMASGGSMALPLLAKSGGALGALPRHDGRLDFRHGAHVAGDGDGQSDDIKAMLADGEFVFPADVVSALGNGSTKAGSDKLYEMMHAIRDRARSTGTKDLPPPALKSPLDYLKKGSKK